MRLVREVKFLSVKCFVDEGMLPNTLTLIEKSSHERFLYDLMRPCDIVTVQKTENILLPEELR